VGSLADLLFELSSEERMAILKRLSEEPLKLSHVASRLDLTVTEASRHLQRLVDNGLIRKDSDGLYTVTPYSALVLSLVPGLDFVSQNRTYFAEHSMSAIPPKFRNRIGELFTSEHLTDTIMTVTHYWEILNEAEEFTFSIKTNPLPALNDETIQIKTDSRSILQEGLSTPEAWQLLGGVTRRFLPKVEVFLLVTEKEALFSLPYLNGNIDYCAFMSGDHDFRSWCKDLFLHFWEEAKPNPSIAG
jgi:predicted transcriptional regulator